MIDGLEVPKAYDSIDGVPEPAANPHLIGHGDKIAFLTEALAEGRMHHALLFEGPQGIGKATLAFHLAGHLLAKSGSAAGDLAMPDYHHPVWRQIAGGMHPAVLHINRPFDQKTGKFRTAITVEEIRRVTHFLTRTAHDGAWRIVIVDPADDMNRNAANALLKTLEEPPAKALFILISHSAGRLLPTIRSRCQSLTFKALDDQELAAALGALAGDAATSIAIQPSDISQALLERSEGSVRKALLLVAHGGLEIADTVDAVLRGTNFDLAKAQALGTALSGRDAEIQYELFRDYLLDHISGRARQLALQGQAGAADQWARFWSMLTRDIVDAETYNLDRRQSIVTMLEKTQRAFNGRMPQLTA